jgi:hypothetical protein
MSESLRTFVYRPLPDVRWVVQLGCVQLLRGSERPAYTLRYPAAAIWEMANRGYALSRIVATVVESARVTPAHARLLVIDTLDGLAAEGFVTKELVGDG